MARVDFYVLSASGANARLLFACRLAEKAYRLENTVHILTPDDGTADRLDELLWTYRDGSFVPHERIARDSAEPESPVTISSDPAAIRNRDLLINLGDSVPPVIDAFPRVAELVTSDEGHELETHKI